MTNTVTCGGSRRWLPGDQIRLRSSIRWNDAVRAFNRAMAAPRGAYRRECATAVRTYRRYVGLYKVTRIIDATTIEIE